MWSWVSHSHSQTTVATPLLSQRCRPPFLNLNSLERSQPYLRTIERVPHRAGCPTEHLAQRKRRVEMEPPGSAGGEPTMPAEVGGRKTEIGTQSCTSALSQNPNDLEQTPASTGRQGALVALVTGLQASLCPCWAGGSQGLEAPEQGKEEKAGASVTSLGSCAR